RSKELANLLAAKRTAVVLSRRRKWRRQLPSHRDNGFARGYFLGVTMIDAQIEGAQFRIFSDRGPGALNQLVAQPAVARAGNPAAIFFLAGGVLARDNPEESSNLAHVANLAPVAQPGHQVRGHDHPDAGKAGEQTDRLPQFRIVLTKVADLLLGGGGRVKMKMQRPDQLVQLKAHRFRARQ